MKRLTRTNTNDTARTRVALYIRLTPLLWATGLLVPVGMGLCASLAAGRRSREVFRTRLLWAWWAVGSLQAVSVVLNWAGSTHDVAFLAHKLVSATVIGWFLLGLALAVGRAYDLASPQLVRSVAQLGLALFALAVLCIGTFYVTGRESVEVLSPVGYLFPPDIPAVTDFFTMHFFTTEHYGGVQVVRLALFYPWAVMLGFAGIAVFFISLHDKAIKWRILGMSGGLVALAGSESRAAIAAFVVVCIVFHLLRLHFLDHGAVALAGMCVLFLAVQLVGVQGLKELPGALVGQVGSMRRDSSDSRRMVYEESWNGFLRSPVIGQGWPGENVADYGLTIGTHSTIYGVLYTGGLLTFVPLCFALALTSLAVLTTTGPNARVHRSAVVIMLSLLALLYSEGIYCFVAPALFSFWWIGGALRGKQMAVTQPVIRVYRVTGRHWPELLEQGSTTMYRDVGKYPTRRRVRRAVRVPAR